MRSKFLMVGVPLFFALPAMAATLDELVPQSDGASRCWQRLYDADHLASHPDQQVTGITFAAGYAMGDTAEADIPGTTLFGMAVTLRDGARGSTGGSCWPDEKGLLRCGVECDGGGVALTLRDAGSLLIDLETTGYIRMDGECGGGDEASSFDLEPGLDDRQFLLASVDEKACKGLLPPW